MRHKHIKTFENFNESKRFIKENNIYIMRYIKNYEKYKINEFFLWDSDDQSKIKNHFSEKGNLNSDEEILNAIDNDKMKGSDLTELTLHYLANNKDYKRLFNFVENMSKHFNYILDDIIEKEDKKIVDWFFKNMKDRLFNHYKSPTSTYSGDISNADNTLIAIKMGYDVRDILKTWLENSWEEGYVRILRSSNLDKDYKELYVIFDHLEKIYEDKDLKDRKVKKSRLEIISGLQYSKVSDKMIIKILDTYPFLYEKFTKANINTLIKKSGREQLIQNYFIGDKLDPKQYWRIKVNPDSISIEGFKKYLKMVKDHPRNAGYPNILKVGRKLLRLSFLQAIIDSGLFDLVKKDLMYKYTHCLSVWQKFNEEVWQTDHTYKDLIETFRKAYGLSKREMGIKLLDAINLPSLTNEGGMATNLITLSFTNMATTINIKDMEKVLHYYFETSNNYHIEEIYKDENKPLKDYSQDELRSEMDIALDNKDFEYAKEIGEYLEN
jgi:hypothetical protein